MVSVADYKKMANKPSKYRSVKVEYTDENGEEKKKDSKKEYRRLLYLKELEKRGQISHLQEQVVFVLQDRILGDDGKVLERAIKFVADFVYCREDAQLVVEDVKSWITKRNPTYILKRKLFKKLYPQYIFRES